MQADNLVVYWLRPVPPVEHAQAVLTVTGPDALVIAVSKAQQGPIVLTDGVLQFTGLSHKDQYLALSASVQGGVPDLLKVLREKGLHLLSDHPLPITGSAGKAVARLAVNVPMFEHLRFDQVTIASKGRLSGLRLDGLVAGRPISDGDIGFDVTQDGLNASGTASVDGLPGQVEVGMNFRSGGPTEDRAAGAVRGADRHGGAGGARDRRVVGDDGRDRVGRCVVSRAAERGGRRVGARRSDRGRVGDRRLAQGAGRGGAGSGRADAEPRCSHRRAAAHGERAGVWTSRPRGRWRTAR